MARHPLCRAAGRAPSLPRSQAGGPLAGRSGCRAVRPGRPAGAQGPVHRRGPGCALWRGLPDRQRGRPDAGIGRRTLAARHGVHPWRRLQRRVLAGLQRSGTQLRAHRQGRLRQLQLPARRARIPGLLSLLDAAPPDRIESRPARPGGSPPLGAAQHPGLRRRPRPRDDLRRVRGWQRGDDAHGDGIRTGSVRAGDRPERTPQRRVLTRHRRRVGRSVRRDPAWAHRHRHRGGHRPAACEWRPACR